MIDVPARLVMVSRQSTPDHFPSNYKNFMSNSSFPAIKFRLAFRVAGVLFPGMELSFGKWNLGATGSCESPPDY